jgi:prevent-host-death family protein
MTDIGIRELKTRVSEIIKKVRHEKHHYIITLRGRPVALLSPLEDPSSSIVGLSGDAIPESWDKLIQLGEEIGRNWKSNQTSTELLSTMRR